MTDLTDQAKDRDQWLIAVTGKANYLGKSIVLPIKNRIGQWKVSYNTFPFPAFATKMLACKPNTQIYVRLT